MEYQFYFTTSIRWPYKSQIRARSLVSSRSSFIFCIGGATPRNGSRNFLMPFFISPSEIPFNFKASAFISMKGITFFDNSRLDSLMPFTIMFQCDQILNPILKINSFGDLNEAEEVPDDLLVRP